MKMKNWMDGCEFLIEGRDGVELGIKETEKREEILDQ